MTARPVMEWDAQPVAALTARWGVPLLEAYAEIGSTNDRALELAVAGAEPYSAIVTDEQTAGRGRRGGRWFSESGHGLLISLVLPIRVAERPAGLPLLVGLATAEAIEHVVPEVTVRIKWPNDLWIRGLKVAGILCESTGGAVVAGVGINVRPPPVSVEGVTTCATSLEQEAGWCPLRHELAEAVVGRVRAWLRPTGETLSAAAHAELARRDGLADAPVSTDSAGNGIGAGFAEDGALLLLRPDGSTTRVVAGSVRLR